MKDYPNFYENIEEANRRLKSTIVAYDGAPYHVLAIANHKADGIFRVYLEPLSEEMGFVPHELLGGSNGANGDTLDAFLQSHPKGNTILRKQMNSPKFNKFRPFPLGMCNVKTDRGAHAYYVMRQPTRNKEQGLTDRMVLSVPVRVGMEQVRSGRSGLSMGSGVPEPNIYSREFVACVLGEHPSLDTVLKNLNDPDCANESAAFHREFAIARGPVGTLFLVYKKDVVGFLPNNDASQVNVSSLFEHTLEPITELGMFDRVQLKRVKH